jgi:hypothetical protein
LLTGGAGGGKFLKKSGPRKRVRHLKLEAVRTAQLVQRLGYGVYGQAL